MNGVDLAVMHLIGGHQAEAGVVVILVIPVEEAAAEASGVLDAAEALREAWLVFEGLEAAFLDSRYVVTNIARGSAEWLYDTLLLRARSGREPDQAAQEPTGFRPDQLPLAARQPGSPAAAHRRLLAAARAARRHPRAAAAGQRHVRHPAAAPDQDRRPRHRGRHAGAHRLRRKLPRGRSVRRHRALVPTRRAVTHGASAPNPPGPANPQRLTLPFQYAMK